MIVQKDEYAERTAKRESYKLRYKGAEYSVLTLSVHLGIIRSTIYEILKKKGISPQNRVIDVDDAIDEYVNALNHITIPGGDKGYTINGKTFGSVKDILKEFDISYHTFYCIYKRNGSDIEKTINKLFATKKKRTYLGKTYPNTAALAEHLGINTNRLRDYIKKCGNAEKAIKQIRVSDNKDMVFTKDDITLNLADLAAIMGVKQATLIAGIDDEMTFNPIKKSILDKNTDPHLREPKNALKMEDGQTSLLGYCINNKLSYGCLYNMVTEYRKSVPEAINYISAHGQKIPAKWIKERYGILLAHMQADKDIDIDFKQLTDAMKKNMMPLREALEYAVVRKEADEKHLDPEWQHVLYTLYTDAALSEKWPEYVEKYCVTSEEIETLEESREKVAKLERLLDLYKIAEGIYDNVYTDPELLEQMKTYEVTDQEAKKIFNDFCQPLRFGVSHTDERLVKDPLYQRSVANRMDYFVEMLRRAQDVEKETGKETGKEAEKEAGKKVTLPDGDSFYNIWNSRYF